MTEWITKPWPWYVAGPLIGLTVPLLLLIGNRTFGISSSLRHVCAACIPANFLMDTTSMIVHPKLVSEMATYGIDNYQGLVPSQLFNWPALLTTRGFILMVIGGFLVGFGTRYAGGCTSGHSIMGLSNLQWPSLIATCCFMLGGFIMANLILPLILKM